MAHGPEDAEPDPEDTEPEPVPETPEPTPAPPIVAAPPSVRAPSALAATSLTLDLPPLDARGSLPFKHPEDLSPAQRCSRTKQLPQWPRPGLGETAPPEDDSLVRAMALVPFLSSLAGGPLILGGLTLDQYVSFHAELAVSPEAEAALLAKYLLHTPAAHAEVDQQWQRHLARNAAMRAVYEEKLAGFIEHARQLREQAQRRQG